MSKVRQETELKGLQTRLTTIDQEILNLEKQKQDIKRRHSEKKVAKQHLEIRLAAATEEFNQLNEQKKQVEAAIVDRKATKVKVFSQIKKIERQGEEDGVRITEHAILRFLERVKGVDIEQIKREMIDEKQEELISKLQTCKVDQGDCTLVVSNRIVVTVHEKTKPNQAKHKAAPKHKRGKPRIKDGYDPIKEYENGEFEG